MKNNNNNSNNSNNNHLINMNMSNNIDVKDFVEDESIRLDLEIKNMDNNGKY